MNIDRSRYKDIHRSCMESIYDQWWKNVIAFLYQIPMQKDISTVVIVNKNLQ